MKKKKSKKKVKYVEPPMKWNSGAHKYEVDLPSRFREKEMNNDKEVSLLRFIMFIIVFFLITGVLSWVIDLLF